VKEGRATSGEPVLPRVDRIKYEEIAADLHGHYEASGNWRRPTPASRT
jgi:hypothetical protein